MIPNPGSLDIYLEEINAIPLLRRDEEDNLIQLLPAEPAKRQLVRAYLGYVIHVAKRYQGRGVPLSDLINEGNIGLMSAVDKVDSNRGRFAPYADLWIKQKIRICLNEKSRVIRLPEDRIEELVRINEARDALYDSEGHEPTNREIARHLDIPCERVDHLINVSAPMASLESQISSEGDSPQLIESVVDTDRPGPLEKVLADDLKEDLSNIMGDFPPEESETLRLLYGLGGEEPLSMRQVGLQLGLTKRQVQAIKDRVLNRLRRPPIAARLRSHK